MVRFCFHELTLLHVHTNFTGYSYFVVDAFQEKLTEQQIEGSLFCQALHKSKTPYDICVREIFHRISTSVQLRRQVGSRQSEHLRPGDGRRKSRQPTRRRVHDVRVRPARCASRAGVRGRCASFE